MFYPNFGITWNSIIVAVGHAFLLFLLEWQQFHILFLDKNVNIVKASTYIVIMDTLIALVAGLIIFSITFKLQEPVRVLD